MLKTRPTAFSPCHTAIWLGLHVSSGLRCVSLVALKQPAEPFPAHDRSVPARGLSWLYRPTVAQSLVRPFQVVMLDVLLDHVADMGFAKEDHALETLSFGILYPSFGVGI